MAKFHFHTQDGACLRDEDGIELASFDEAKDEAVKLIAELLGDDPALVWKTGDFTVTCSNDDDLTLFKASVTIQMAPAAPSTRFEPPPPEQPTS